MEMEIGARKGKWKSEPENGNGNLSQKREAEI